MLIGYARVSSNKQETDLQLDALRSAGVRVVYSEKASSVGKRPTLRQLLSEVGPGDVVMVYKLDRVARSLKDLLEILESVAAVGASIRSLTECFDTTGPIGEFIVQILGAVAQLERSIIRQRAIAGQVAARRRGVRWGGARVAFTPWESEVIYRARKEGWPVWVLAEMFGVSRCTISRVTMRKDSPHLKQFQRTPVLGAFLNQAACQ